MKRIILAALVGVLVSGPVWAEDVAICTGTLAWPSGRTTDYEFRLVFSRWTGKLIVKGWTESFQFLNDKSADIHAITGRVNVSTKDEKGVQEKKWSSGIKGFAAGSAKYFTALVFGGGDGFDGGSIIYPYTLVYNGDVPDKPLVLGSLDTSKPIQDGVGTCR